ncbi:MAG: hypothetical protein HOV81_34585 [Kofleriaceae bacterium]|nr:hypothetical protein [Kofleriaceae bacterium]
MTTTSLSISLLLALGATMAGCAAQPVEDPGEGGGGSGGEGGGSSEPEPVPLTPEGRFAVTSDFDIATNMPGTAGAVINGIISATDDADDPTHWILDQLVAQLPAGSIKNTLQGSIPFVSGYLNDRLLDVAPDFVGRVVDLGDKFGQVARHFGTLETLEISANGAATKTVTGVQFTVDQLELSYAFADYNMDNVSVPNLTVTLEKTGKLTVSDHKVPLSYGKILRLAIDEMVIPMIDPTATNLEDVLKGVVNCQAVGQYVYEAIDIGSPSTFEQACKSGLKFGAQTIYAQIDRVNQSALEFGINGIAKGVDKNGDGKMDKIQTGAWAGTLTYSGQGAPLSMATFVGARE